MTSNETIRDLVESSRAAYPELPACSVLNGETYTYREVGAAIAALHRFFASRGVLPGDRIALVSENQPAWSTAYLAVTSYGATVVPVLPEFTPHDIEAILAHSEAQLVLASQAQMRRLSSMERVAVLEEVFHAALADSATGDNQTAELGGRAPALDDTAAIIYTSGTTGHSKGVVLSHRNLTSNVAGADTFAHIQAGERLLSVLPLAHTYECTLGMLIPFSRGAHVTYLDRPASPTVLSKALAAVQPNLMLAVPLLIEKVVRARVVPELDKPLLRVLRAIPGVSHLIYRAAGRKLRAAFGGELRFFGIGGAPLAPDVEDVLMRTGFPYAIGYGLTETSPLLAGTSPGANKRGSTGKPVPGVSIRIVDGEIQARGPNVMAGYYRDDEQTAAVFTEDGWFRTGDIGEFDRAGRLSVKGRSKTVIITSNGENVYPEAIESLINQIRAVGESLVIQKGSQLVARVRLETDQLAAYARGVLGAAGDGAARVGSAAGGAVARAGTAAGEAVNGAAGRVADAAGIAAGQVRDVLEAIRNEVNARVSSFSRISRIELQEEPFEKTPTSKIKRYLYQ